MPGEPPEDGEMDEMTLPFRHRIRDSSPCSLRSSSLPLCDGGSSQYLIFMSGKETFCFFETWRPECGSNSRSATFQAGSFKHWNRGPAGQRRWLVISGWAYFSYLFLPTARYVPSPSTAKVSFYRPWPSRQLTRKQFFLRYFTQLFQTISQLRQRK